MNYFLPMPESAPIGNEGQSDEADIDVPEPTTAEVVERMRARLSPNQQNIFDAQTADGTY